MSKRILCVPEPVATSILMSYLGSKPGCIQQGCCMVAWLLSRYQALDKQWHFWLSSDSLWGQDRSQKQAALQEQDTTSACLPSRQMTFCDAQALAHSDPL